MATVVLTVLGTAIGGPIGGAIGGLLGQGLDSRLFGSGKRQGPRLKEVDVQTSSYGTQIPAVFGKMRVAGSVIWATDLVEHRKDQDGGKGRPDVTTYSYSANLAVALSSRPITSVGRIWADGKLLRGAAGDFKSPTVFRLYSGAADQPVDPLMASALGPALATAHRDLAYVVFEGMALEDYGNRIPSMTFEVIESSGSVRLVNIANAATDVPVTGNGDFAMLGFALAGQSQRDALGPLVQAAGGAVLSAENGLVLTNADAHTALDVTALPLSAVSGRAVAAPDHAVAALASVPKTFALRYYDEVRDYQAGMQSRTRPGPGQAQALIDLPVVITAQQGRDIASAMLFRGYRGRETLEWHAVADSTVPDAGAIVTTALAPGRWRIEEVEWMPGAVRIQARRIAAESYGPQSGADSGSPVTQADLTIGKTVLAVLDLPLLSEGVGDQLQLAIAAAGQEGGWRRAALYLDRGAGMESVGFTMPSATMGIALDALGNASPYLSDTLNGVTVQTYGSTAFLQDADETQLSLGRNAAWLGGEIIQFGRAQSLGGGRFRLSQLRRGLFGTERHMATHAADETFVLLERDKLKFIDPAGLYVGRPVLFAAQGLGDEESVDFPITIQGNALRPYSPVHPRWSIHADGALEIAWLRRTRLYSPWRDGVDAPLGEENERYVIRLADTAGSLVHEQIVESPMLLLDGAGLALVQPYLQSGIMCSVRQLGRHLQSHPLEFVIQIPAM